ncbi:MAG: FHA domain-containing protein [Lachnospiraceae bacterium]|nr:FHA domain-containing protein [Lachnospiraceae bacterium]
MEGNHKTNHYYISLPSQKTDGEIIDFEMKMLEQNQIRGLLPAAREYQDSEVKIYFDISGRQNLEQRYAWQKMTGWELRQILCKIAEVAAELEEYMLDYNHLNLMPEFMYGMLEPGDLCFCYEPWDSESFAERLRPLALWFLDHMDYREREEVIFSYEFQRFCDENDVSLALLGQFMSEKQGGYQSGRDALHLREGRRAGKGTQKQARTQTESKMTRGEGQFSSGKGRLSREEERLPGGKERLSREKERVICGEEQMIRGEERLSREEERLTYGGDQLFHEEEGEENDSTFAWGEADPDMDRKKSGGMRDLFRRIFPAGGKRYPDYSTESLRFAEDETEYGRTTARGRENARRRENARAKSEEEPEQPVSGELISEVMPALHIRGYPCFLGRDGDLTDCEIADESVSRIHARLFQENGRVWVEDLRSENGTFVNGDRMLPNEPWVLEDGDELRVGSCSYRFRR